MAQINRLTLCVLTIFTFSCNFQPEGEIFTEIAKPSIEELSLNLNDITGQTIQLKEKTTYNYSIETGSKQLIESRVFLDNDLIWATSFPNSSFQLDPESLNTGIYKLKIEVKTTSNSGSLAEKLGIEQLLIWKELNVLVDHEIPQTPDDPNAIEITSVEVVDNSIIVNWSEYSNFNFQYYELIRDDFDEAGRYVKGVIFPPQYDAKITSQHDYLYVGGHSKYQIKLYAAGDVYTSEPFDYEHSYKPLIHSKMEPDGGVTILWNSLRDLKNNFSEYKLVVKGIWPSPSTEFTFSNVTDTSAVLTPENFSLGFVTEMTLNIIPPSSNGWYSKEYISELRYGEKFPTFDHELSFNKNTNNFYFSRRSRPHMSNEKGELLDSIEVWYDRFIVNHEVSRAIGMREGRNFIIDLKTMTEEEELILNEEFVEPLSFSMDNKILIYTETGAKVVNASGEKISTFTGFMNGYSGISPDGRYVFFSSMIYEFNGTQYEVLGGINTHYIFSVDYLPGEPSKIVIGYADRVVKFDLETMTEELVSTSYKGPCNYDDVSGKLGCKSTDHFVVVDPSDLTVLKSLAVVPNSGYYYLYNETVICSQGAQIELSEIP